MKRLTKEQQKVWDRLKDKDWYRKSTFDGVTWMPAGIQPTTPVVGSIYLDTNDSNVYVYDGKSWMEVTTE
jgi:hypothetical protein